MSLLVSLSNSSPIRSSSFVAFSITRGVELSHLCQASFSAMIAASFFFSFSISCWLISNCCCLLLHAVVAHPELDTKAQEGCQCIMVNDAKVVTVMHYRIYNILKFLFSYFEPYNLGCFIKLFFIYRHLFF